MKTKVKVTVFNMILPPRHVGLLGNDLVIVHEKHFRTTERQMDTADDNS